MQTFSAGDAVLNTGGLHVGRKSMLRHFEHISPDNFKAGLDTPETHHTSIKPLPDQRSPVRYARRLSFFTRILVMVDSKFIRPVLKLTFSSGIADRAFDRMVDE
jgi:hypothetical protein